MSLQESGEMYLETILVLTNRLGEVRSLNVAQEMGFSKPSVSRAIGLLKKNGYVVTDDDGFIFLTESGTKIAEKIYERHNFLSQFLIHIGVDKETAVEDACKMEHVISDISFEAMKDHANQHKK